HAQHRAGEIDLELTGVDQDLAAARLDPDARNRVLAFPCCIGAALLVELLHVPRGFRRRRRLERGELVERLDGFGHGQALLVFLRLSLAMSRASGFCAACGWSGPA